VERSSSAGRSRLIGHPTDTPKARSGVRDSWKRVAPRDGEKYSPIAKVLCMHLISQKSSSRSWVSQGVSMLFPVASAPTKTRYRRGGLGRRRGWMPARQHWSRQRAVAARLPRHFHESHASPVATAPRTRHRRDLSGSEETAADRIAPICLIISSRPARRPC